MDMINYFIDAVVAYVDVYDKCCLDNYKYEKLHWLFNKKKKWYIII